MATTISPIFNKTLFQRLLDSRKLNTEKIYFDKTTTTNGENPNKVFNIDPTIFYKPFEIEINYDKKNQIQPKNTIAFFCCRKENKDSVPTVHVFSINDKLCIDMCNSGSTQRKSDIFSLNNKGKINIQYNEGIIKIYYDDVLKNTYDLSDYKITNGLPNKCAVGQSYSEMGGLMANGINGTVNVKIKKFYNFLKNGLLSDLVSISGYLCDHGTGNLKTDTNNSVIEIHLKNSYNSITLKLLKNEHSSPSYVRVCQFNESFITGKLEFYGSTVGKTTTFNLNKDTKIVKITTETVNLKNYDFYFE